METRNKEILEGLILLAKLVIAIQRELDLEILLKKQQQYTHFKERRVIKSYGYCKPVKQHQTHNQKRQLYGQSQRSLSL